MSTKYHKGQPVVILWDSPSLIKDDFNKPKDFVRAEYFEFCHWLEAKHRIALLNSEGDCVDVFDFYEHEFFPLHPEKLVPEDFL